MTLRSYLVSSLMLSLVSVSAMASSVEVLHWWTAGGEAKAAGVLRSYWQALGNEWQDSAISGGGVDHHLVDECRHGPVSSRGRWPPSASLRGRIPPGRA